MTHQTELTVKEYAARERVTERTVWNWISKGAVPVRHTPGGRVRIPAPVFVHGLKNSESCGSSHR